MPRATVTTDTRRVELKSCPEGYVVLRPMPYGTKLSRSQEAMKMTIRNEAGPRKRGQAASSDTEVQMLQMAATLIDFRACVVDHNLEDEGGRKLDLGNQRDFESLDPRIGEEISSAIDELNNFEAGEEGNSETR